LVVDRSARTIVAHVTPHWCTSCAGGWTFWRRWSRSSNDNRWSAASTESSLLSQWSWERWLRENISMQQGSFASRNWQSPWMVVVDTGEFTVQNPQRLYAEHRR